MCTVTFLPLKNGDFIFTSNRDENPNRKTIPPKVYQEKEVTVLFPKDELAGGTWIGLSEKKRLVCLLNGGYELHEREDSYRMSRGLIVKQLLVSNNIVAFSEELNLNQIEPFTIVIVDWESGLNVYEMVWTGERKDFKKLDNKPQIWSSSTLYTQEMKELRKDWFASWLTSTDSITQSSILQFHLDQSHGEEISLKMKRPFVETVSVTSIQKKASEISLQYINIIEDEVLCYSNQSNANETIPTREIPITAKNK